MKTVLSMLLQSESFFVWGGVGGDRGLEVLAGALGCVVGSPWRTSYMVSRVVFTRRTGGLPRKGIDWARWPWGLVIGVSFGGWGGIYVHTLPSVWPGLVWWTWPESQRAVALFKTDGEGVISCTVGGNVNWCSHYGTQYGGSSKN